VRDQRKLAAKYVGLDGLTGLSILKLPEVVANAVPARVEATESAIAAGQRVHLFAPEPVAETPRANRTAIYARLGDTEARITRVMRGPGGNIFRVRIRAPKLSPASIGGVVLNDSGQTIGIIDTVRANEATVLPATSVRNAAKRVLERQASVPRPWLGIRGESIEGLSVEHLTQKGWQPDVAYTLARQQQGILLTSVLPGSPASTAELRPGDVILTVNDGAVRTAEDFSWVLQEAGSDGSLKFTIARPGKTAPEAVEVKLTEAPDPLFGLRSKFAATFDASAFQNTNQYMMSASLLASGMETIALLPKVASRLGSDGGLLVIYVEPATAAFKAGLRPGDVIETINGQQISRGKLIKLNSPGSYSCVIVRNKQKLVMTFEYKENE
jgi:S1-C subfamily serine protease